MKIKVIIPIKLQNERLPGKNTKILGDKPLISYILDSLHKVGGIDNVYVYCSDVAIEKYLDGKAEFLSRPEVLDLPTSNFTQIFATFMESVDSDIYVYAHATAPFVTAETIQKMIEAVKSGEYDSAFTAVKIQDFLWKDGEPLNFDATNLPRSQDLDIIYRETSGIYVFTKGVFEKYKRRVGIRPFICEVDYKESVDINTAEDFEMASMLLKAGLE